MTISWLSNVRTVSAEDVPVIVGRDANTAAQVRITDQRISFEHIVLIVRDGQWVGHAKGRNGVFIDGHLVDGDFPVPDDGVRVLLGHPGSGLPIDFSHLDPADVYVGAQITARREALRITQRGLAADKVINGGTLINIEKGRSRPRHGTAAKLEETLGWEAGHIEKMRRDFLSQGFADDGERTQIVSPQGAPAPSAAGATTTIQATLLTETVAVALTGLQAQIAVLPDPGDPEYPLRAAPIIAGLARLETAVTNAARGAVGAGELIRDLSEIRKLYRDLMLKAAKSRGATLGQKLFAARHRAELSIDEVAAMGGVTATDIRAIETGAEVAEDVRVALNRLLAALS